LDGIAGTLWPDILPGICSVATVSFNEFPVMLYPFHHFKMLPEEKQLEQLTRHGIALDLWYCIHGTEAVLFAYHSFYVELVVEKYTDEILSVNCFQSTRKLRPYLQQIDISEINVLLACSK
jgi:hypothetical protein